MTWFSSGRRERDFAPEATARSARGRFRFLPLLALFAFLAASARAESYFCDYMDADNAPVETGYRASADTVIYFKGAIVDRKSSTYAAIFQAYTSENHEATRIIIKNTDYKSFWVSCHTKAGGSQGWDNLVSGAGIPIEGTISPTGSCLNATWKSYAQVVGTESATTVKLHSSNAKVRFWYFRVVENGVTVCDWRPYVQEGTAGYYDVVGETFATSATGSLTPGPRTGGVRYVDGQLQYQVEVVPTEGATATLSPAGDSGWYAPGTSVTVTSVKNAGFAKTFVRWSGNLDDLSSAEIAKSDMTLTVSRPRCVQALYNAPGVKKWVGAVSALASEAANWGDGDGNAVLLPPCEGDSVVVAPDADGVTRPMTWDIDDVTLAAWTQNAGCTNVVTFQTGPLYDGVSTATPHGVLSADGARRELVVTGDITLDSGTWTHTETPSITSAHPGWSNGEGVYRLIARAGGDFTVAADATLDVDRRGFRIRQGPSTDNWGSSSHGGVGAYGGNSAYLARTYGKIRAPVTQGTGGGTAGSGSIELSCGGRFTLDGTLNAGQNASCSYYSGAGGAIFVTAGTFRGTGSAQANSNVSSGGCGGGGRLAFVLTETGATFDDFTGTMSCCGNHRSSQAGTLYLETPADKADGGVLVIPGRGSSGTTERGAYTLIQPNGEDFTFANIILTNKVLLGIASNVTVTTKNLVSYGTENVVCLVGGTFVVPNGYTFTNVSLRNDFYPSQLATTDGASGTNLLAKGVTFTIDKDVAFGGTLHLLSGSTITHSYNKADDEKYYDADYGYRANFSAENLVIDAGASVSVNSRGYGTAMGPGAPKDDGKTDRSGSHGGLAHDVGSVKAYGSITRPTTYGSGGKDKMGSGATHIRVKNRTVLDGTICADCNDWYCAGAAGSVWLETGALTGASTGRISADVNPPKKTEFYGAGGGRVAVTLTQADADLSNFLGVIQAKGGGGWYSDAKKTYMAGDGTVYIRQRGEAENAGTLIVSGSACDNDDNYTDITDAMTDCLVGHVVVTNYGRLRVRKGAELQVRESFANASKYAATHVNGEAGDDDTAPGTVAFVEAGVEASVTGTNNFMCLKCAAPGKTVRFGAAADTLTAIDALGQLQVAGSEASSVRLRGLAEGTPWLLAFHGKADVVYADVQDSDARAGDLVSVDDTNTDSGNNQNWRFVSITPGETIRWTGESGTGWATAGNWDRFRAPVDTDVVVIPVGSENMPALTEGVTLNRLEVEAGASLALGGFSLTVTNGVACAGSLVCSGSEALTFAGDVTIKGFTAASATLNLVGAGARRVDLGGHAYRRVVVDATDGASLSFVDGFATDYLTCACDAPFTLEFAAGKTFTVGELALDGVVGSAAALTLKSTTDGAAWNLYVTGKACGSGLIVRDSHVTSSIQAFAYAPSTQGDNVTGWVFGVTETTWKGGTSGNWSEPANWSGGAVPGADSCVHFASNATVTLDVDDATANVLDVSDCTVNLKGAKTLTVKTLLEVLAGGTLSQASSGNVVRVEGAAFVRSGGKWTHASNGTSATDLGYGVHAQVLGNLTVDAGGEVSAYGCGFGSGYGPGSQYGSSHGGKWTADAKPCYGSIFRPRTIGSMSNWWSAKNAGGRVYLNVGGTLTVNGAIDADATTWNYYNGSGGSVYAICGTLAGSGTIHADGGDVTENCAGCGGRVAVYQRVATDFAAFAPSRITANGGVYTKTAGSEPMYSGGSVYLQSAGVADGRGTVYVRNNRGDVTGDSFSGGVDVPVTSQCPDAVKAYRRTTFALSEGGVLFITRDVAIGELELARPCRVNLNGHTLAIYSRAHRDGAGWPTGWNSASASTRLVYPGADASGAPGQIVWLPRPMALIVR